MNKFEKLIEYIINDEDQKARELFHDIVVEKSRDIYESIMDDESLEENFEHPAVAGNQVESMVDEVEDEEAMGEDEEDDGEEFSLDSTDQDGEPAGSFPADDDDTEPTEDNIDDKVMNIDAKLDELLAKFDEIMGHDEPADKEPEMGADMGADMGEKEPEIAEEMYEAEDCDDKEEDEEKKKEGNPVAKKKTDEARTVAKTATELMREYVETIGDIYGGQGDTAEGTAVGASGKKTAVNTKPGSVGPGANFGGTVVKATGPTANQDGTTPTKASNEYNKGQGEIKSGNRNVPGGKAGSPESTGKEYSKERGAEGQTTDGKLPVAKKSVQVQNTGKK